MGPGLVLVVCSTGYHSSSIVAFSLGILVSSIVNL